VNTLKQELGDNFPQPNAFQQAILDNLPITFAQYQGAMEATASCFHQRQPDYVADVAPEMVSLPEVLIFVLHTAGGQATMYFGDSLPSIDGSDSPQAQDNGNLAASGAPSVSAPNPAATDSSDTNNPLGSGSQATTDFAVCEALSSAEVEDWWMQNRPWALTGSALEAQRSAFIQCMNAAGMNIPADSSNAKVVALANDPNLYNQLTPAQQSQASDCDVQYQAYLWSVAPPG
jgi:hypothetical protein